MHFLVIVIFLMLAASPTHAQSNPLTIQYGFVNGVEVTTKESAMARNILIGSLLGLAIDDSTSGALKGATAGFVLTSFMEGDKRVFAYTIKFPDGSMETVAVDRPDLGIGHCAALERHGSHVNLRPVSAVHCEDSPSEVADDPGGEHRLSAAEKCSKARASLAAASEGAEVKNILREMRAYCD
jgi:hypothetical protein